ncbi:hypothetical protein [Polaromonas sp. YR568]|uniref:hypothetical protein n=1 Tax=Polaromonas sp. YR568 TaxID=1855301 RepID=UPI00398C1DD5
MEASSLSKQPYKTASLVAVCAVLLAGCASDGHTPANTRCGDLQFSQNDRLVESNGASVTIRRMPFTVSYAGKAQGVFRLHAASPNSPTNGLRDAPKDLWLVDSRPLVREPGDLRLAGHLLEHTRLSSYSAGPDMSMPRQLRRPAVPPSDSRAVGRLDYNETTVGDDPGKRLMRVTKVQGQALPGSKWPVLHLTSLVGALAPASSSPEVVNWSACTVFFE